MSDLKTIDLMFLNEIFEPKEKPGYVLDFGDNSFSQFFRTELSINIDEPKWSANGGSKGKRLRYFLQTVDNPQAVRTLEALWEYRQALRYRDKSSESVQDAEQRFANLIARLGGKKTPNSQTTQSSSVIDSAKAVELSNLILNISALNPQSRGFEFEKFLKSMFDAYGLVGRPSFRNKGEQIDGSFELGNETYLVEAKWQNTPIGVSELHSFHGKVGTKTAWARGLFISYSGFSEDGLTALGTGIRIICMDGRDLHEMLSKNLKLEDVLARKVRRAAETGKAFVRVSELF